MTQHECSIELIHQPNFSYLVCLFFNVNWNIANVTNVTLAYSVDWGSTWNVIAESVPADNAKIAASVTGSYQWTVPDLAGQTIYLRITNSDNAQELDRIQLGVTAVTPLLSNKAEKIFVYPNPATSRISVDCNQDISLVEILSATGKLVRMQEMESTLDVSHLPQGFYILKVTTQKGEVICEPFIKK